MPRQYEPSELILAAALRERVSLGQYGTLPLRSIDREAVVLVGREVG